MGRMDNPKLDDTLPTSIKKEGEEETLQIQKKDLVDSTAETQPTASPVPADILEEPAQEISQERPLESAQDDQPSDLPPGETAVAGAAPGKASKGSWILVAAVGVLTLVIIALMSAYGGYRSGMNQRDSASSTLTTGEIQSQYNRGLEDMSAGRYDLARQRFEWVIQHDPGFPGATDRLAEVIMRISITASPTFAPSPTLTPSPDTRTVDDLYAQAQQAMVAGDWSTAIDDLLRLRKVSPDFHAVEVDGMFYVALRNRGLDKIKKADLEGGTYDLDLAEGFGPLDAEAIGWRDWAAMYITGASFWEVDWLQVIAYFEQLVPMVPNMMDASSWTATERLRIAYQRYGDQLAQAGDWCEAEQYYQKSLNMSADPKLQPTSKYAADKCSSPGGKKKHTDTPAPPPPGETPENTPTPPPPGETPENTPTPPPPTPYP